MLAGHGYSLSPGPPYEPTARRAPGYPLFLALVYAVLGRSEAAVLWAQALLWGVSCVLLARLVSSIFDTSAGVLAGLVVALHPVLARIAGGILTESLYILCVIGLISLFDRALNTSSTTRFALTGVLMGVAALIRPLTGGLMPFLWVGIWMWRRELGSPLRNAVVMTGVALVCVVPWQIRNVVTFKAAVPLQVQAHGSEVWIATMPAAELPVKSYAVSIEAWKKEFPLWRNHYLYHEDGRPNETTEQLKWETALIKEATQRIRQDPLSYLASRIKNYPYLWLYSEGGSWLSSVTFGEAWRQQDVLRLAGKSLFLLMSSVVPLVLAASLWFLPGPQRQWYPLWIVPLFIALVHLPIYVEHRFAVPAEPFVWGLASGRLRMFMGGNE